MLGTSRHSIAIIPQSAQGGTLRGPAAGTADRAVLYDFRRCPTVIQAFRPAAALRRILLFRTPRHPVPPLSWTPDGLTNYCPEKSGALYALQQEHTEHNRGQHDNGADRNDDSPEESHLPLTGG